MVWVAYNYYYHCFFSSAEFSDFVIHWLIWSIQTIVLVGWCDLCVCVSVWWDFMEDFMTICLIWSIGQLYWTSHWYYQILLSSIHLFICHICPNVHYLTCTWYIRLIWYVSVQYWMDLSCHLGYFICLSVLTHLVAKAIWSISYQYWMCLCDLWSDNIICLFVCFVHYGGILLDLVIFVCFYGNHIIFP